MRMALEVGSGLLWTVTYVLIVWRGFADKTYGMPLAALAANLSWEFIFGFLRPDEPVHAANAIIWFIFDVAILYTALRFGPREFPGLRRWQFYAMTAGILAFGYFGVLAVSSEFDRGPGYAAFGQNLMMSALFISMLINRRSLRGQSVWIAAAKLVGTALASLSVWRYYPGYHTGLMVYLCLGILVLDIAYLLALLNCRRQEHAKTQP